MPDAKKLQILKRVVLVICVCLPLTIGCVAKSQTTTPAIQPTPKAEASPAVLATPVLPAAEQKTLAQPTPLPTDSTVEPPAPALPTESPNPSPPAEAPVAPLLPPVAGPGTLPSPTPKPTLAPETLQALDQQFQDSLRIRRAHPKQLVFFSLMDAVRIALYQNPDVRLAVEDAQLAKGALVKATVILTRNC